MTYADAGASVWLTDGRHLTSDVSDGDIEVTLRSEPVAGGVRRIAVVTNRGPTPVRLDRISVLEAPVAELPYEAVRISQTGYQSASFACPPIPAPEHPPLPEGPRYGMPPLPGEGRSVTSAWASTVYDGSGRPTMLGFTSAQRFGGAIGLQERPDGSAHLTAYCPAEGVELLPGATAQSEPLLVLTGDEAAELQRTYAQVAAETMGARQTPPITGWCSWYWHLTDVTEAHVREAATFIKANRDELPLTYVQLDDGYQRQIGDWLSVNEKFPSGLAVLAADIRGKDLVPGIWLAPFLVGEHSQLYAEHPEYVLHDATGAPVVALPHHWGGDNYALDATHPGALAYLRSVVRTMRAEYGFGMVKADFIFAAAMPGVRHQPGATRFEAYRMGMAAIREELGDGYLLASGDPLLPVGFADAVRTGTDVGPTWRFPGGVRGPSIGEAVQSNLARTGLAPLLQMDPDCTVMRTVDDGGGARVEPGTWDLVKALAFATGSSLTRAEVRTWNAIVAMTGGLVLASEDFATLSAPARRELARLLPPTGIAAVAEGGMTGPLPDRLRLTVPGPDGDRTVLAVFNWSDEPVRMQRDVAAWAGEASYAAVDLWEGSLLSSWTTIEPHGVALIALNPTGDRPRVAATTMHVLGGVADVRSEQWNGTDLTVELNLPGRRDGELLVTVPPGLTPNVGEVVDGLLRVPVTVAGATRCVVGFTPVEAPTPALVRVRAPARVAPAGRTQFGEIQPPGGPSRSR